MSQFLVELYVSRTDASAVAGLAERARVAAEELTREGVPVRYVRSMFLPEDETCFFLCEASTVDAVREAVRRAELPVDRVAEALAEPRARDEASGHPRAPEERRMLGAPYEAARLRARGDSDECSP
jgi:uncharacterized protein DUF4242